MYKVALVLSVVIWAVIVAVIFSAPTDVRRTVQMLRDTRGKTTPPVSSLPRFSISSANARRVQETGDPADYEGFVTGGVTYSMSWLRDATALVSGSRDRLAQRPVCASNSGPLGAEATDAKGVDLTAAFEPRP
jgi:hypothetical protein